MPAIPKFLERVVTPRAYMALAQFSFSCGMVWFVHSFKDQFVAQIKTCENAEERQKLFDFVYYPEEPTTIDVDVDHYTTGWKPARSNKEYYLNVERHNHGAQLPIIYGLK